MEELLVVFLQGTVEFLSEVLLFVALWPDKFSAWFEFLSLSTASKKNVAEFLVGNVLAGFSLLVVGHTILASPFLRAANLVGAPFAAAYIAKHGTKLRANKDDEPGVPADRFWNAFWFTFGFVIVRFFLASSAK